MNDTLETRRLVLRVELTCFYCGHSYGEVRVPVDGRPTYRDLRKAVEAMDPAPDVAWDAHGAPRCPRCHGKLFIEESERRVYTKAAATPA